MPAAPPLTIGWKELVDLPDLGLYGIKAKIDTGARTSALHVDYLERLGRRADGTEDLRLAFRLPPLPGGPRFVTARAVLLRCVDVTGSGGQRERRPLIATRLSLGPVRKTIQLTLADRSSMLFRMILGRTALGGDFLIRVSDKYLLGGGRRSAVSLSRRRA